VTDSDESVLDNVDDFSSVLQLRRSFSAQSSYVFHEVRLTAFVP
jgi:hypothetical protein